MKKRSVLALPLVLFCLVAVAFAGDLPWEMKLPFKQATIRYELKGSQQGTETLYVKEFGKIRAKHHKSSATIMGMTKKSDTIEITDPDWVTTYDLIEKTGEKVTNPTKLYLAEYNKFNSEEKRNFEKNSKELGASMMGKFGGSIKQKSAQHLGYDCDVSTIDGMSNVYLLHGSDIPLRSEVSVMGMTNSVNATAVDTNASIQDSVFMPPAGITATSNQEAESMIAGTIKQTMDTLKRPDGAKAMQQMGSPMMPIGPMGEPGMEDDGPMSKEEHAQMMKEMEAAMERLKQMKPQQ